VFSSLRYKNDLHTKRELYKIKTIINSIMEVKTMTKKDTAIEFLKLAYSGDAREAYEKYVHLDFTLHNVFHKGDRESLIVAMEEALAKNPNKSFEVTHALEDGDLVAVHTHVTKEDGTDFAVVHIFRFEDNKIIEIWDVGMVVPKDLPPKKNLKNKIHRKQRFTRSPFQT